MTLPFPPASFCILLLIVIVGAISLTSVPRIVERNALRPYNVVRNKEFSTLITNGFVHADVGHLFFNSLTLYFFGPGLEATIGTLHFLVLYFLCLVISSLGTVVRHRNDPDYSSLGASGAILGVLFAYIVYYPTSSIGLYFVVAVPAVLFALGYLAYSIWASKRPVGNINHDAHIEGALTGLLFVAVTDFGAWRDLINSVMG